MKLLGHAWVAVNAVPEGNNKLLILGSILPEIMYYTKDHPFEFEEIHEGGDRVYQYLKENKPDWADLGLGMLAHSVKAGADKYNFDENLALLGYEGKEVDKLRERLADTLGVSCKTAKTRAHNILELAAELRIIREHPGFVEQFNDAIADQETRVEIKKILTNCFDKTEDSVSKSVDEILNKAKPEYFRNARGLADLWAELSKEFDPVPNKEKLSELLIELSEGYSGKDTEFFRKCIEWTKGNLENVLSNPERK